MKVKEVKRKSYFRGSCQLDDPVIEERGLTLCLIPIMFYMKGSDSYLGADMLGAGTAFPVPWVLGL